MIRQNSHFKGRKYTKMGIMSILNEKMGKWGSKDAIIGQNEPNMSQNYFLNYTKTDNNEKSILKWNRLSNVNFLHFTRS